MKMRYRIRMERLEPSIKIYVAFSQIPDAGRGVFAAVRIEKGEIIEQCPIIEMMEEDARQKLHAISLRNYYFIWGDPSSELGAGARDRGAICLGFGSIYNHSYQPNARYLKYIPEKRIDFVALRDIANDEEILVNYNGEPGNQQPLWSGALGEDGSMDK